MNIGTIRKDELSAILTALAAARPDLVEALGLVAIATETRFEPNRTRPAIVVEISTKRLSEVTSEVTKT